MPRVLTNSAKSAHSKADIKQYLIQYTEIGQVRGGLPASSVYLVQEEELNWLHFTSVCMLPLVSYHELYIPKIDLS